MNCPRLVMLCNLKASTNNEQLTGTYSLAANDDVGINHKRLQVVRVVAPLETHWVGLCECGPNILTLSSSYW